MVFSIFIKRNKPEHLDWIRWSKPQTGNDNFIIGKQYKAYLWTEGRKTRMYLPIGEFMELFSLKATLDTK